MPALLAPAQRTTLSGVIIDRSRLAVSCAVLVAVAVSAVGVLPAFLIGALAVQIRADLDMGPGQLGLAATVLFAVTGALVRLGGRLVQHCGPRVGASVAALLSIAALGVIAVAPSANWLMLGLAVGGVGNAVAGPLANQVISEFVSDERLGLAFGIKQSSIPAATLLAGLAVPAIGLVFGWRWAVAVAIALAILVLVLASTVLGVWERYARSRIGGDERVPDRGIPRGGLVVLTIGGFFGSAAATSTGIFLVDSAVASGIRPGTAGLLFATCSVLGLASRVGFGWLADRRPLQSPYLFITTLMLGGAIGYGFLAAGPAVLVVIGSMLAYGLGWAWPGLFHFAVIRDNRSTAASVTGFVLTGLSLGAAAGPLIFGVLGQFFSYRTAWLTAAVLGLIGGVTVWRARLMVQRSRGPVTPRASQRLRADTSSAPRRPPGRWLHRPTVLEEEH